METQRLPSAYIKWENVLELKCDDDNLDDRHHSASAAFSHLS